MKFSNTILTIFLITVSVSLSNACSGGGSLKCPSKNKSKETEMCKENQVCMVEYMKSGKIEIFR